MRTHTRGEEGSALLIAILAMVFLTVIGLTLAMVTETEMLIGTNDQIAQENFVAAESGVAAATAQLLVNKDVLRDYFTIPAREADGSLRQVQNRTLGYVVDFSDVYPVAQACAPYTECSEDADHDPAFAYFFFTKVRARRMAWPSNLDVPDCATEAGRSATTPPADYFQQIQAEDVITIGFYASPLPSLGGEGLYEGFKKSDAFGCEGEKKNEDYNQLVPTP